MAQESTSLALAIFRAPETFELLRRRRELTEARALLVTRERRLDELRTQLISFEGRYLRQVGLLYRRLDDWERKIAELHGEATEEPIDEVVDLNDHEAEDASLRTTFRDLVKLIHPDFAKGAEDELRRTRLMAQANDAYLRCDLSALKRMLNGYEPEVALTSADSVHNEVTRTLAIIFQITQDIEAVNLQIEELQHSDSAKLLHSTLEAARGGRDLLAEMAARVNGSIGMAMRRYELDVTRVGRPAMGPAVETLVTAETSHS